MLCNARLASKVCERSLVPQRLFPAAKGVFLDNGVNLVFPSLLAAMPLDDVESLSESMAKTLSE